MPANKKSSKPAKAAKAKKASKSPRSFKVGRKAPAANRLLSGGGSVGSKLGGGKSRRKKVKPVSVMNTHPAPKDDDDE